jgi:endonuclease-3
VTRAEKAERIRKILQQMYALPRIPLRHEDPYTLLIAVILSAQCTDRRVNEVTPRLFARARDPYDMSKLGVPQIRAIIRPCGLAPSKARNIRALSKILVDSHAGQVPKSMEALEALPGVGHKTASVVMAQAFGEATFPVDTHIHRLAARWGLSNGTSVRFEAHLSALGVEPSPPPDHLLRPRPLPRARTRFRSLPDLLVGGVEAARRTGRRASAPGCLASTSLW